MSDDRDRDENVGGLFGAIRGVLEALSEAEREGRSDFGGTGRYSSGHFTTEYGFSGGIGGSRPGSGSESGPGSESGSRSTSDSSRERGEPYRVDVRYDEEDNELLVVADLPDVETDDLTLGLDERRNELVIGVDDRAVERLELPWPVADVDARFRHEILELRFTPEAGGGEE